MICREGPAHHLQSPPPDKEAIIEALCDIYDPEIPVNIYDLGLIYHIELSDRDIAIAMTLTAPGCPVAGSLPGEIAEQVASVSGVGKVEVSLVWDPPWTPDCMSDDARLALGMV